MAVPVARQRRDPNELHDNEVYYDRNRKRHVIDKAIISEVVEISDKVMKDHFGGKSRLALAKDWNRRAEAYQRHAVSRQEILAFRLYATPLRQNTVRAAMAKHDRAANKRIEHDMKVGKQSRAEAFRREMRRSERVTDEARRKGKETPGYLTLLQMMYPKRYQEWLKQSAEVNKGTLHDLPRRRRAA